MNTKTTLTLFKISFRLKSEGRKFFNYFVAANDENEAVYLFKKIEEKSVGEKPDFDKLKIKEIGVAYVQGNIDMTEFYNSL